MLCHEETQASTGPMLEPPQTTALMAPGKDHFLPFKVLYFFFLNYMHREPSTKKFAVLRFKVILEHGWLRIKCEKGSVTKRNKCQYSFFASSSTDNRCARLTLRALCDGTEYSFSSGSRLSTKHRRKQRKKQAHECEK